MPTNFLPFGNPPFDPSGFLDDDDEDEVTEVTEQEPKTEKRAKHPLAKRIDLPDGSYAMVCVKCHRQFQWAEANQDNGTLICYSCRTGM
jgi:hypothetical protein